MVGVTLSSNIVAISGAKLCCVTKIFWFCILHAATLTFHPASNVLNTVTFMDCLKWVAFRNNATRIIPWEKNISHVLINCFISHPSRIWAPNTPMFRNTVAYFWWDVFVPEYNHQWCYCSNCITVNCSVIFHGQHFRSFGVYKECRFICFCEIWFCKIIRMKLCISYAASNFKEKLKFFK